MSNNMFSVVPQNWKRPETLRSRAKLFTEICRSHPIHDFIDYTRSLQDLEDKYDCLICNTGTKKSKNMKNIGPDSALLGTICGHVFHRNCLIYCLEDRTVHQMACPLCATPFRSPFSEPSIAKRQSLEIMRAILLKFDSPGSLVPETCREEEAAELNKVVIYIVSCFDRFGAEKVRELSGMQTGDLEAEICRLKEAPVKLVEYVPVDDVRDSVGLAIGMIRGIIKRESPLFMLGM